MFIQIIAQILAALPFVSVFWQGRTELLAVVPALLIIAYVLAGGFMGASLVGTMKTIMLMVLLCFTGIWLYAQTGSETYVRWWTEGRIALIAPEAGLGWVQGAAMVIGIFSTQAYLQPVFASLDAREAKKGTFTAGIAIILVGFLSAWIGLYMHETHPGLQAREAIPQFFLTYAPNWFAGAAYAVILLSVVMTGAALTLSIGTIMNQDVIQRYSKRFQSEASKLAMSRALIFAVILIAYLIVCIDANSLILQWAFLAMTLRGVTVFFPVILYLFRFGPIDGRWAELAIWGAPLLALLWSWLGLPLTGIDPLYLSGLWSLGMLLIGKMKSKTPLLRPMS